MLRLVPQDDFGSPQAAAQLAELRHSDLPALAEQMGAEFITGFEEVLEHFERHHDVNYKSSIKEDDALPPAYSGISMLHLACIFKKTALVRSLLEAGAKADQPTTYGAPPLLLAVGTELTPYAREQDIISTANALLEAGARPEMAGRQQGDLLTFATVSGASEDVLLHLMDKGAAANAETALLAAQSGYLKLLRRLPAQVLAQPGMLHASLGGTCSGESFTIPCMDLLLEAGADVNAADSPEAPGYTPLFVLARELAQRTPDDKADPTTSLQVLEYLLRHGADPHLRAENDEDYPNFSPYDFLSTRRELLETLAEHGLPLTAPALHFSPGVALLSELIRTAGTGAHSAAELAPHFDTISSVFTPSPAMQQHELFPHAVAAAVNLLSRIDPARAAESIQASPLWQAENTPALSAMLEALEDTPEITLPKELLLPLAEKWARAGQADPAAMAAELLGRCADAAAELQALAHSDLLPLQAGALLAQLSAEDLPDARNSGVADWLLAHHREANTPFLQEALLLTSHERFWQSSELTPEQNRQLIALMRRIGAPQAAHAYEQISLHSDDPDTVENILSSSDIWSYELEAATARYFLQHKAEFTHPASHP